MKFKQERIKKLITQEIMRLVAEKTLKDPRIPDFITVTHITLSKDLHYCHIYISILNDCNIKTTIDGLNSAKGFIQKQIADVLALKYTPKIEFRYDEQEEKAYKVDKLLSNIARERKENQKNQES